MAKPVTARELLARAGVRATPKRVRDVARVIGSARKKRASISAAFAAWKKANVKLSKPVKKRKPPKKAPQATPHVSGSTLQRDGANAARQFLTAGDLSVTRAGARAIDALKDSLLAHVRYKNKPPHVERIELADGYAWELSYNARNYVRLTKLYRKRMARVLASGVSEFAIGWGRSGGPSALPTGRLWHKLYGWRYWSGLIPIGSATPVQRIDRLKKGERFYLYHTQLYIEVIAVARQKTIEYLRTTAILNSDDRNDTRIETVTLVLRHYDREKTRNNLPKRG